MKIKLVSYCWLILFTLVITGCAIEIHGNWQQVAIICDPKRASIDIDGAVF